ncbi:hypothetical protein TNCV_2181341 [Trichonephila clavipes]|uniref:Uncharacterized protein n=1 Tax=Trichonephila clavipes TaxID=2585209 RepID=A0A8X6VUT0_TRICX|nr:hypothetical protein TNCV_2181341 [Trichonephila clavipes]
MAQLINRSDWSMVMSQSLGNHGTGVFVLARDLVNMLTRWYWARTHDMPAVIRYLDHWATAAPTLMEADEAGHLTGTSVHAPQRPRSRKLS